MGEQGANRGLPWQPKSGAPRRARDDHSRYFVVAAGKKRYLASLAASIVSSVTKKIWGKHLDRKIKQIKAGRRRLPARVRGKKHSPAIQRLTRQAHPNIDRQRPKLKIENTPVRIRLEAGKSRRTYILFNFICRLALPCLAYVRLWLFATKNKM